MPVKVTKRSTLENEYSACQASIEELEARVWQSAALLGLASVTSLALVASNEASILVALLIGATSSFGTFLWWRLANRWWSLLHAKMERMIHIEEELQAPGQQHYIAFLDELHGHGSSRPVLPSNPRIPALARAHRIGLARARRLASLVYEGKRPKEALWPLPWLTVAAWLFYLAYRIVIIISPQLRVLFFFLSIGPLVVPGA